MVVKRSVLLFCAMTIVCVSCATSKWTAREIRSPQNWWQQAQTQQQNSNSQQQRVPSSSQQINTATVTTLEVSNENDLSEVLKSIFNTPTDNYPNSESSARSFKHDVQSSQERYDVRPSYDRRPPPDRPPPDRFQDRPPDRYDNRPPHDEYRRPPPPPPPHHHGPPPPPFEQRPGSFYYDREDYRRPHPPFEHSYYEGRQFHDHQRPPPPGESHFPPLPPRPGAHHPPPPHHHHPPPPPPERHHPPPPPPPYEQSSVYDDYQYDYFDHRRPPPPPHHHPPPPPPGGHYHPPPPPPRGHYHSPPPPPPPYSHPPPPGPPPYGHPPHPYSQKDRTAPPSPREDLNNQQFQFNGRPQIENQWTQRQIEKINNNDDQPIKSMNLDLGKHDKEIEYINPNDSEDIDYKIDIRYNDDTTVRSNSSMLYKLERRGIPLINMRLNTNSGENISPVTYSPFMFQVMPIKPDDY